MIKCPHCKNEFEPLSNHEPWKVKFYKHTLLPNENGCMIWNGSPSKNNLNVYGKIQYWKGKGKAAHRYSYELHFGAIPVGMHVLHKCDIPKCVAPNHLFLGTQSENMFDMHRKNRHAVPLAEEHHNAKLTNDDVRKIKDLRKDGMTYKQLAKIFHVSPACISHIFNNRSYKSV
jgi:hypothetical protein